MYMGHIKQENTKSKVGLNLCSLLSVITFERHA